MAARLGAVLISCEVLAYALATIQAAGLTVPAIVAEGPGDSRIICERNVKELLDAEDKMEDAEGQPSQKPLIQDLDRYLANGLPVCPRQGEYQIVSAGETLRVAGGRTTVVPEGRIAIRCAHGHDFGIVQNPFLDVAGKPGRAMRFGVAPW